MYVSEDDAGFLAGLDLPYLLQVGVKDISAAVFYDAGAGVGECRQGEEKEEDKKAHTVNFHQVTATPNRKRPVLDHLPPIPDQV